MKVEGAEAKTAEGKTSLKVSSLHTRASIQRLNPSLIFSALQDQVGQYKIKITKNQEKTSPLLSAFRGLAP